MLPTKRMTARDIIGYEPVEVATVSTRAASRKQPTQPPEEEAGAVVDVISGGERTQVNLDAEGNVKTEDTRRRGGR